MIFTGRSLACVVVLSLLSRMLSLRSLGLGLVAARGRVVRASSSLNVVSRTKLALDTATATAAVAGGAVPRERHASTHQPPAATAAAAAADDAAPAVSGLTVAEFRKLHQISVKGEGSAGFEPWINFEDTPFSPSLKRVFTASGYSAPTSIQAQAWPIAIEKRDVISVARTGSGKTCGFLLPALHRIMEEREADKFVAQKRYSVRGRKIPSVLVLAPTRELAVQIEAEAQKFSRAANAFIMSMYGGAAKGAQVRRSSLPFCSVLLCSALLCSVHLCSVLASTSDSFPPRPAPPTPHPTPPPHAHTDPKAARRRGHRGGHPRALQRLAGDGRAEPVRSQVPRAGRGRPHARHGLRAADPHHHR